MKKFVLELFTNRFGIVLAALNLCYLAGHGLVQARRPSEALFLCLNAPAALSTSVAVFAANGFLPPALIPSGASALSAVAVLYGVSMVFQWLFIAWASRKLAARWSRRDAR